MLSASIWACRSHAVLHLVFLDTIMQFLWVANCTIGMSALKPRVPVGGLKMCQIGDVM